MQSAPTPGVLDEIQMDNKKKWEKTKAMIFGYGSRKAFL